MLVVSQVLFAVGVFTITLGTVAKVHFRVGVAVDTTGRASVPRLTGNL